LLKRVFVVRRRFRDKNGVHTTGSIVKPEEILRFKRRVQDGNIIEVTEQTFDSVAAYMLARHGVTLIWPEDVPLTHEVQLVDIEDEESEVEETKVEEELEVEEELKKVPTVVKAINL